MIRENEVIDLLGNKLPGLNTELEKLPGGGNVYKTIQCFADFTKQLIGTGNIQDAKQCFRLAENMLEDGTAAVKNAIENVFLHSLSPLLDMGDALGTSVKNLLRGELKKEYSRRVCASGI